MPSVLYENSFNLQRIKIKNWLFIVRNKIQIIIFEKKTLIRIIKKK